MWRNKIQPGTQVIIYPQGMPKGPLTIHFDPNPYQIAIDANPAEFTFASVPWKEPIGAVRSMTIESAADNLRLFHSGRAGGVIVIRATNRPREFFLEASLAHWTIQPAAAPPPGTGKPRAATKDIDPAGPRGVFAGSTKRGGKS
jgi:hypothetical protein